MLLCGHVYISLGYISERAELLGHMVTTCLTFYGIARLFSEVAVPFNIPAIIALGFQFLHILTNTWDGAHF